MTSDRNLKRLYGLEPHDIKLMLAHQLQRCAICAKKFNKHTRPYCVDHDHKTGLVRGLLCGPCNEAIGFRHDNADWFKSAYVYLTQSPMLSLLGRRYVPGSPGAEGVLQ